MCMEIRGIVMKLMLLHICHNPEESTSFHVHKKSCCADNTE